jgi:hypothetical protein
MFQVKFPVYVLVSRNKVTDQIDRFFGMPTTDPQNSTTPGGCMVLFSTPKNRAEFRSANIDLVGSACWGYDIYNKRDFLAALERMRQLKYSGITVDPRIGSEPVMEYSIDELIEQLKAN